MLRTHGTPPQNAPQRFMPQPQTSTLTCPVAPDEKAKLIADLQRTPAEELVQFWDQHNGIVGMGCKLKSASDVPVPHIVGG